MRVVCYQAGVEGISLDDVWRTVLIECALLEADLLVTPEYAIGGLPHTAEAARENAIADPLDLLVYTAEAPPALTVVLGFTEDAPDGRFSSVAVISGGEIVAVVRKVNPREPGIVAGGRSSVIDIAGVPCGILICADVAEAKLARRLASSGARLLICPLNNDMSLANAARWQDWSEEQLVRRARENGCWVVSADVAGRSLGRRALALTAFVQPDGRIVQRTLPDAHVTLTHDIDRI
ncbi:carbon-nitrogen hydrolase family protein [Phytoactinopolyspora halotolerans]|uniref:Carbon-nitrogen hydrolase family protein n=1 Tax=Phytoactinopolyspora halotolerans TaxID=1981512 RepID=A0A6L9S4T3_9ACTN|nr:carbon-nitrogen hydrolase family protein [Phytoactinopolyspora halotolerans]NEE00136.1 carbon-nitrogen hydrolase family protein [Phytoactinopolyspora halotolerans]